MNSYLHNYLFYEEVASIGHLQITLCKEMPIFSYYFQILIVFCKIYRLNVREFTKGTRPLNKILFKKSQNQTYYIQKLQIPALCIKHRKEMKERVSKLTYPMLQHCLRMLHTMNGNSKH